MDSAKNKKRAASSTSGTPAQTPNKSKKPRRVYSSADPQLASFLQKRTTAELESFQNHILMYAGKRFAFSFGVYEARTLLAALDYNHHNHRPVHVNIKGQVSHKRVYDKRSQRYSVHTVKETKDYGYIPELQTRILEKRLSSAGGLPKRRSIQADDPRALGPLSGISPPPTAELVQTQQRRGQDLCDT
uniref:Si:dkeyp-30e7.2 n=1 Tax=Nothobranchius rachovii TaxID=451742 RepID=A0A1A8Q0J2_9TELE